MNLPKRTSWFQAIAPGILMAATGVGAGDLLTASLAGSELGVVIVWAALLGGVLKFVLNEGLARWQMATDTTLLEGWADRLGRWIQWVFLAYLIVWTFVTAGALMNACGVAGTGLLPIGSPTQSKIVWGIIHSLVGLALVRLGGFRVFEVLMTVCIGIMFVAVMLTVILIRPDVAAIGRGLLIPTIPEGGGKWILGLVGGVGGTVTMLSYGYWVRERGRSGERGMRACRLDLAIGYTMTSLFGVAMVVIGSRVELAGRGAAVSLVLAEQLSEVLGPFGKWVFLVGFWGAVFSSLLGVWQSVPYLFADFLTIRRRIPAEERRQIDYKTTPAYRRFQIALAIVPMILLGFQVKQIQLSYAILGALFMPLLALTLLILNSRSDWVGRGFRSGWLVNGALVLTLLFFGYVGASTIYQTFSAGVG